MSEVQERPAAPRLAGDPVAAAQSLVPSLRNRGAATEAAGRLSADTVADLDRLDLFSLMKPQRYGGRQTGLRATLETIGMLARGDASTAWVASVTTANSFALPMGFPEQAVEEVFADPSARITSVVSARKFEGREVEGGIHIDEGVWGFNSGVYHAQWDTLFAPLANPSGGIDFCNILTPTAQLETLDDWDVMGLRATGSTTVRLRNAFVPNHRISRRAFTDAADVTKVGDAALYRISPAVLGPLLLLAVPLGAAEAALELFIQQLPGRKILHTKYSRQGEAAVTHLEVAGASARIDAAKALISQEVECVERTAEERRELELAERGRIRRSIAFAATLVTEAANILAEASGGSFNAQANPLNRVWRDIQAGSKHAVLSQATAFEAFGRICCGLDPENPTV